jgi:hypothetical protein
MTDSTTTVRPRTGPAPAPAATVRGQALITEQQVLFETAAAVGVRPATTGRWTALFGQSIAAIRRAAGPPEPVHHRQSDRHAYLRHGLMAREMERL